MTTDGGAAIYSRTLKRPGGLTSCRNPFAGDDSDSDDYDDDNDNAGIHLDPLLIGNAASGGGGSVANGDVANGLVVPLPATGTAGAASGVLMPKQSEEAATVMDGDGAVEFGGEVDDFGLSDVEDDEFAEGEERLERRLAAAQLREELVAREADEYSGDSTVVDADDPTERHRVEELPAAVCPICDSSLSGLSIHVCHVTLNLRESSGPFSNMPLCRHLACRVARKPLPGWHAVAVASTVFY
jgi:hypothetical protein